MGTNLRVLSVAFAIMLVSVTVLVFVPPQASAASKVWTTDADFNEAGAILNGVEVVGTGVPASVHLLKDNTDWKNNVPPTTPGSLEAPSLAFSTFNNLTILFGGYNGTYLDRTWEYNWATNTWTEITSTPKPPGRQSAGLSYDPVERVAVLFGGFNSVDFLQDTWEYNVVTKTWTNTTNPANRPPQMVDNPLVYHASASRHVFIGQGLLSGTMATWAYDAAANSWANRNPSGMPSARSGFSLAHHASRDRTVLFGGAFFMTLYDQTYEYNYAANSWSLLNPNPRPSGRTGQGMTYRPFSTSLILFGGQTGAGLAADTWRYTAAGTWETISTVTTPPARRAAGMTYDTKGDGAILFGGVGGGGNRLWDTWSLGAAYRAAGRYTSAVFDSGGASVVWQTLWWNKTPANQPANVFLRFQIATSNAPTGPFNFFGPGGSPSAYYTSVGTTIWTGHNGQRYLKFLGDFGSTNTQNTPQMDDVTINFNVPPAPPYIVTTDPAHMTFGVSVTKVPRIVFSEAMNRTSVTVTFLRGTPVTFTHVWSAGDTILDLTHSTPFRENMVFELRIDGRDLQGDALVPNPIDPNVVNPFIFVTEAVNPFIVSTNPSHSQTNVALNAPIVVTWSEPMNTTTVQWTISPSINLTASWSGGDSVLTLNHAVNFAQCTQWTVQITQGRDKSNVPMVPGPVPNPWSFTSACINPYITSTSPSHLQPQIALTAPVIIDFSKAMNTGATTMTIVPDVGGKTFQWTNGNTRLTMSHTSAFTGCTTYTVTVTGQDTSGNTLIAGPPGSPPNPFKFVTVCNNPYIVQTNPADGAVNVSTNRNIMIAFSETMNTGTVQYTVTPSITVVNTVWSADVLLTLEHAGFQQCTRYTVHVTQGQNVAGAGLVPGPAPNPWSFDVICDSPYITTTSPTNGSTLVPVTEPIVVNFSEPMDTPTVVVNINPAISLTRTWSNGDQTLTLTHAANFVDCTTYTVFVDGIGKDGNSLLIPGPGAPNPWSFTTRCIVPNPYIVRTDPAHMEQNVPLDRSIVVEFSEAINRASFQVTIVPAIGVTATWSAGDTIVTLSHTTPFPECRQHTVTVSARDLDGNALTNVTGSKPNPWTFRTFCVPPQILTTNPANGAVGVPQAAPIVVTFSEAMNRASVTWTIVPTITVTATWSGGDTILTLSHTAPFSPGTMYTVTIAGRDLDGNSLAPGPVPNPWSFTTAAGLPAPGGLQVIRMPPNDVLLTWRSVPGAASYLVFSSTDKFAPFPSWAQLADVPTTTYFAAGHLSDGLPRYYIVRAKDAVNVQSANSTMGAKIPMTFSFSNARSNIFWLSLPYRSMYRQASDITDELTSSRIDVVAKWNPQTQSSTLWFFFRGAWRGTNFPIAPGDGLYIGVRSTFAWVLNGTDGAVSRSFSPNPPPMQSVNWISLPFTSTYRRATDLVLDLEGSLGPTANTRIVEVAKWDAFTQSLVTFAWMPTGWQGTDFTIAAGEGVYLRVVSNFNWTPRLITPEVP